MKKLFQQILILSILAIALIAQITHSTYVFDFATISSNTKVIEDINIIKALTGWNVTNGFVMAVAVELAIFLFVIFNLHKQSFVSMLASMMINMTYYYYHGHKLYSPIHLLESFILPYCIANFSQLLILIGKTNPNDITMNEEFSLIIAKLKSFNLEMFTSILPKFKVNNTLLTNLNKSDYTIQELDKFEKSEKLFDENIIEISQDEVNNIALDGLSLRDKIRYYLSLPDDKKPKNNDELAQLAQCSVPSVIKYKKELKDLRQLNLEGAI